MEVLSGRAITALAGAPVGGVLYITASGFAGVNTNAILTAGGALTLTGALACAGITATGSVGIGTAAPAHKLHVSHGNETTSLGMTNTISGATWAVSSGGDGTFSVTSGGVGTIMTASGNFYANRDNLHNLGIPTNRWASLAVGTGNSSFAGAVSTGALTTNGGLQTFGANDSAGAGFRTVRAPNV